MPSVSPWHPGVLGSLSWPASGSIGAEGVGGTATEPSVSAQRLYKQKFINGPQNERKTSLEPNLGALAALEHCGGGLNPPLVEVPGLVPRKQSLGPDPPPFWPF